MEITVIGLGYVGGVAAAALASAGHHVTGLDVDSEKVHYFESCRVPFYEPGLEGYVRAGLESGCLDFRHVDEVKYLRGTVLVAVGTPSLPNGAADLSQVKSALEWIVSKAAEPVVIVMKSTVPPGTGRKFTQMYISGREIEHVYVSNPEFLREGQALKDWFQPDRIVVGADDPRGTEILKQMYHGIEAPMVITDVTSAELIKYAANAFLATKISFINEIANLCESLGADIVDVAQGIGLDPRIGPDFLKAGVGYGGSCFPKDVRALDFLSTVNGHSFELLRAVININNQQRILPVRKLRAVLGNLAGKKIAVLGLAFKPGTDDIREAPALDIIRLLLDEGAEVSVYDPMAINKAKKVLPSGVEFCYSAFDALNDKQGAIIVTEWKEFVEFDWALAKHRMKKPYLVIDGRNCLSPAVLRKLGFEYLGVGRV